MGSSHDPPSSLARPSLAPYERSLARNPIATATAMIDHEGFPQIIDAVLAAAPESVLVAFRGTSRAYRDRIDAQMLNHIVLDQDGPRGPIKVRSATGRRLPAVAWEDARAAATEMPRWAALLRKHTRIVDYAAEIALPDDDRDLAGALEDVFVVRRLYIAKEVLPWRIDCWRYALPAHKIVDYVHLNRHNICADHPEAAPSAVILDMPPTVRRSITVFRYDTRHPLLRESRYRWQFWDRSGHAAFVCIFVRDESGDPPPQSPRESSPGSVLRFTFLRPLIRALRSYAPSTRPVIVGLTEIPREVLGYPPEMSDADLTAAFLETVVAECLSWEEVSPHRLKRITNSITFLTHAEYCADVGEEEYALETGGTLWHSENSAASEMADTRDVLKQLRL